MNALWLNMKIKVDFVFIKKIGFPKLLNKNIRKESHILLLLAVLFLNGQWQRGSARDNIFVIIL